MRAVRNTDDGVRVVDVPGPEPGADDSGAGGVVVNPVGVGICGSDLHVLDMGVNGITIGHEVGAYLDGRPVAIQPFPFCGTCAQCAAGNQHVCSSGSRAVYGMQVDGGMAEQFLVDPSCIVELPDGIDVSAACLVEPVAVGVHAVHKADLEPGMRVGVVGAGCVGLVAGAVARSRGVQVDIAARHGGQAAAAEKLGLHNGLQGKYDVVFDGAGTDSSIAQALGTVRPAGTVVVPGIYWGNVTMPGLALLLKEVRLLPAIYWGIHEGEREMDLAARLLAQMPELPDALITHRFELDRAAEAFRTAQDRAAGAIKVVVEV